MTERYVREANGGGITWTVVRSTSVWSPGMSHLNGGAAFYLDSEPDGSRYRPGSLCAKGARS